MNSNINMILLIIPNENNNVDEDNDDDKYDLDDDNDLLQGVSTDVRAIPGVHYGTHLGMVTTVNIFIPMSLTVNHTLQIYSFDPYRLAFPPAVVLTCSCITFKWSTFRMSLEAKHFKCFLCFVFFFSKRTHTFFL